MRRGADSGLCSSFWRCAAPAAIGAALAVAAQPAAAQDTGAGVDFQFGNKLDPSGGAALYGCDPRGASQLQADRHRTPTGFLYPCPPDLPEPKPAGDWLYSGVVQFGYLATGGDVTNANWLRYSDWGDGFVLGLLGLSVRRPSDGSYFEFRGSRLDEDNQFYKAMFGRAGHYRVEAFARSQPNVVSGNARPIWNGIGSSRLTLAGGLTPWGSTPAQAAAVSAATPERILQVNRDKQGFGLNYFFNKQWTAYFNATNEERKGARPFGGAFFFNFVFDNNAGVYEIPRPIDDSTVNLNAGLRFAGRVWRMDFAYAASFYRSRHTGYRFEVPFALSPLVPGATSPALMGEFSSEPDNDYHNLRVNFTRAIPFNGEVSLTASGGSMRQDDDLLAPMSCQGQFGVDLPGPFDPFLTDCADWNTPAALSRATADLRIDTSMADARVVLRPGDRVTWRAGAKFHREDYRGTYFAFNPLTGQYGYIAENGAIASIIPGATGLWDPVLSPSEVARVRNLPLDKETIEAHVGADWRLGEHDTLGATYSYTRTERPQREFTRVQDSALKLTWVNRALDWLTFRANYTWLDRYGDDYNHDPYGFTFSTSLPGFVPPEDGLPAHTVDALRKYDIAGRTQHKIDLMATFIPRHDMTLYASVRGDFNDYDAELGRQNYDTYGGSLQWEWQPSPDTVASVFYGYDRSTLDIANVNDAGGTPDPSLGGPTYPETGRWWVEDRQRNHYAGATFDRRIGRVRVDAAWNYTYSRGVTGYRFASPDALANPDLAAIAGDAYPPMIYRVNSLTLGLRVPLGERASVRLFDTYERGRLSDWHYLGFEEGQVIDHRVYTDGGPGDYSANLIGLLLEVQL